MLVSAILVISMQLISVRVISLLVSTNSLVLLVLMSLIMALVVVGGVILRTMTISLEKRLILVAVGGAANDSAIMRVKTIVTTSVAG